MCDFKRPAVFAGNLALLCPLAKFLRCLLFVFAHLAQQAGINAVFLKGGLCFADANDFVCADQEAGRRAGGVHGFVFRAFPDDLLHPVPSVVECGDAVFSECQPFGGQFIPPFLAHGVDRFLEWRFKFPPAQCGANNAKFGCNLIVGLFVFRHQSHGPVTGVYRLFSSHVVCASGLRSLYPPSALR